MTRRLGCTQDAWIGRGQFGVLGKTHVGQKGRPKKTNLLQCHSWIQDLTMSWIWLSWPTCKAVERRKAVGWTVEGWSRTLTNLWLNDNVENLSFKEVTSYYNSQRTYHSYLWLNYNLKNLYIVSVFQLGFFSVLSFCSSHIVFLVQFIADTFSWFMAGWDHCRILQSGWCSWVRWILVIAFLSLSV